MQWRKYGQINKCPDIVGRDQVEEMFKGLKKFMSLSQAAAEKGKSCRMVVLAKLIAVPHYESCMHSVCEIVMNKYWNASC